MSLRDYLSESADVLRLAASTCKEEAIDAAVDAVVRALTAGKALLVCGNGGSAADAMHIAGELVCRFLLERKALRVICLSENPAVLTAWSNDFEFDTVFTRQVEAYGEAGAVLLGISTSGTSRNVIGALQKARGMGMITIAMTGEGGGRMAALADHLFAAPSRQTPLIQQVHLCLYHYFCCEVERKMAAAANEQ